VISTFRSRGTLILATTERFLFLFFLIFFFFFFFFQRAVQLEARAKWDAWNALKGTSKEAAMQKYIDLLSKGDANWEAHTALANYKD
jgi:hypothetical protein